MKIKNSKRWSSPDWKPYLIGAIGFFLAFFLRFSLHDRLDEHFPTLFFAINCTMLAYFYGFWPSFVFLLMSIPVSIYFFIEPYGAFDIGIDTDVTDQIVFLIITLLTAVFFEKLRREQYRATLLQRVSESRFQLLVENDAELRQAIFAAKSQTDN
ncbi:DUF4118 domain-containing protein [Polynucleobacter victoriensis]|uniref:Sensor protein KdpD transmembrane domain-containing protein n=1 Tax=Polynucleobacter victoriensis TaxID=2049319 RepID=A0A212T2Y0_9BURK|nr:DUF4118 domain-containing protein [Polynucleobacter victoriensis]SNC60191.1 protein of unknown function [Polynucleobacter victoriensis]